MGFDLKFILTKEDYEAAFNLMEFKGILVTADDLLKNEAIGYFTMQPKAENKFQLYQQWKQFYNQMVSNLQYRNRDLKLSIKKEMITYCFDGLLDIHKKCLYSGINFENI